MLYLKSMSIDKFKSFKHVSLLLNKGFNCVVGPNGSGKSNIGDALLFSLGESSLRRLRVSRLDQLIHTAPNKKLSSLANAHVKLEFDGDERLEITRGVRADGKSAYRLNGKRMTRQEVLEVLKKHNVHIDETSTIAQGEINDLINLNARQRRELIDIAAGIKEFEFKKKEAMSELEKVGAKISTAQATLGERLGFLKELEKEKVAAESYLSMSKRLKALTHSILTKRKNAVQVTLKDSEAEILKLEEKKKALCEKLEASSIKIAAMSEERQKITKVLSEGSDVLNGSNQKLADLTNEINVLEVRISTGNASITEARKLVFALKEEMSRAEEKVKINEAEIALLKSKISDFETRVKNIGSAEKYGGEVSADSAAGARIKDMGAALQDIEKAVVELREMLAKLYSDMTLTEARKDSSLKELETLNESAKQDRGMMAEAEGMARATAAKKAQMQKGEAETQNELDELYKTQSLIDSELLELKQQRAMARGRDSSANERFRSAFSGKPGFYGAAADLCRYENEYAEAIEAAAGSHFNYFVVESIDVANSMIQHLKSNNMGRATFIPLQELNVAAERKEKGLQAITDLLTFDEKFEKVFSYIFNNTYLVKDSDEAKRIGIGKHRYVTITGETIERSGILSGGSRTKAISAAAIERRLADLEKTKTNIAASIKGAGDSLFMLRKEAALADMAVSSSSSLAADCAKKLGKYGERRLIIEAELCEMNNDLKELGEAEAAAKKESELKAQELLKTKQELQAAYDETIRESYEAARSGMSKEHMKELEALRKALEELRIKNAEMQQENKMITENRHELEKNISEKGSIMENTQKEIAADAKKQADLNAVREKAEQESKKRDKHARESYEKLEEINKQLDMFNKEQGTFNASSDTIAKQVQDAMVKKGQMEVRLNDITAELNAYGDAGTEQVTGEIETMEKEANLLNAKISALGSVNLKAPEVYDERSKSVSDATEKVNTLETEKRAVLSMIDEIDLKKLSAFTTTFADVNKNFSKLYNYIFPGAARIELEDTNDPLNCGLDIRIEDGKNLRRLTLLSGGEKSLISLMLLFAIHMCKPSSLYLFDEIDVALDKENSKKLSQLIKEMSKEAQFVVVSHNDSLIVNADAAIGVVKTNGESKVVGIEISTIKGK